MQVAHFLLAPVAPWAKCFWHTLPPGQHTDPALDALLALAPTDLAESVYAQHPLITKAGMHLLERLQQLPVAAHSAAICQHIAHTKSGPCLELNGDLAALCPLIVAAAPRMPRLCGIDLEFKAESSSAFVTAVEAANALAIALPPAQSLRMLRILHGYSHHKLSGWLDAPRAAVPQMLQGAACVARGMHLKGSCALWLAKASFRPVWADLTQLQRLEVDWDASEGTLDAGRLQSLSLLTGLRELHMSRCGQRMWALASAIASLPTLREVDIPRCDGCLRTLAELFRSPSHCGEVAPLATLSRLSLTNDVARMRGKTSPDASDRWPDVFLPTQLQHLDVTGICCWDDIAPSCAFIARMTALTRLQHLDISRVGQDASSAAKLSDLWPALQSLCLLRVDYALRSAEIVACATAQLSCLSALTRLDACGLVLDNATARNFVSEVAGLSELRHLNLTCDRWAPSELHALEAEIRAKVAGLAYLSVG